MQLYAHPKLKISIEEFNGIKYFKEEWSGIINTVVFRDLINKSISIYKTEIPQLKNGFKETLILSDTRAIELMRIEDVEWLMEEIEPVYDEIGVTHQALIPPLTNRIQDLVELYSSQDRKAKFINLPFQTEKEGLEWFSQIVMKRKNLE